MFKLIEVTMKNFNEIIELKIKDSQAGFLSSNLLSIAESKVDKRLVPMGIYYNDDLVGFVLFEYHNKNPKYVFLKRYMISDIHQGKGFGKSALGYIIDYLKAKDADIEFIELMHYPENIAAKNLYAGLNFELTGEIRDGETVRRMYY